MPTWRRPGDDRLLAGAVALDLGRRALDPQELGRQGERAPSSKVDLQRLRGAVDAQLGRPGVVIGAHRRPARAGRLVGAHRLGDRLVLVQRPRLVHQHDRDAVADRIGEPGLLADQLLALAVVAQRPLGQRADQHFQQLGIDRGGPDARPCQCARAESGRILCRRARPSATARSAPGSAGRDRPLRAAPASRRARTGRSSRAR